MKIPQITIETKPFIMESSSTWHTLEIEQPQATIDIQQPHAEVSMQTIPSKLTIDQTQAWEDMGLKHIFRSIEEEAKKGHQHVQEGMARRASDGDELMKIENKYNALTEISKRNGTRKMHEFNIGFIPSPFSVKIDYQPSELNVDVKVNKAIINSHANKVNLTYQPGSLDFEIKQYNSIDIDFKI
ncbi:hypothetical protein BC6307_19770 [Sutcliffiella cohnii]|uniref:YviE n=1 Tax=Sutcliffiella cohnii TaxID=33932 RepID=A0A223KV25_9BACI|nr:DUF6470 family protein [Sutcliffiella cohnii]AST93341.1 hypothetical protein BC6307_19770 [Sutcliffiella cohnii]